MVSLVGKIAEHLFGRKYYCVTIERQITDGEEQEISMSGYIFRDKESARSYYYSFKSGKSYKSVEIISFRSRKEYKPFNTSYNVTF